ncbi:FeoA family protein [Sphingomonas sp. C3-2]|uniref:FeoA family protein n=1 Tax=Sphingomonas sp. C3-2 TaxID=3062169 RepID=UPI00294B46CD|nr:FeoA family protein [Sphingomonas sp. C3-2]WOK35381.1 FeoA family protein [Sphingomonas sp. C3-2]
MRLDQLPLRQPAYITTIDWDRLSPAEGRRLRELGFHEGVAVEVRHHSGLFRSGPIACQVGRMTIALRRALASAIAVQPGA